MDRAARVDFQLRNHSIKKAVSSRANARDLPSPVPSERKQIPRAAGPRNDSRRVRQKLLAWYRREKRSLPWRGTTDPYRIWVSEVMLQQTTVAAVRNRYDGFLRRF